MARQEAQTALAWHRQRHAETGNPLHALLADRLQRYLDELPNRQTRQE